MDNEYIENLHKQIVKLTASEVASTISLLLKVPVSETEKKRLELLRKYLTMALKREGWI